MNASQEFVKGKHGIGYVDSDFTKKFKDTEFELVVGKPTPQILSKRMTDAEIESELNPGICTLGDLLHVIQGEEYKDGKTNLFYFPACVVRVRWDAYAGKWIVDTWDRDGSRWLEGRRVFSPATVIQTLGAGPSESLTLDDHKNGHTWEAKVIFRKDIVNDRVEDQPPFLLLKCTKCPDERILQGENIAKG